MHSFLNNIADAYAVDPDLRSYTFVFPNVRSKRYFAEYLESKHADSHNLCITLTQLTEEGYGKKNASSLRLIFLLYKAYSEVCAKMGIVPQEFDRFRFWGQRILQDFNDVDHYMANAEEVFDNTRHLNQIQSLYLNDAQKEIIEQYWGNDPYWKNIAAGAKAEEFPLWNHITPSGEVAKAYTQLWALLYPIYREFHKLLKNQSYPGMAAKAVAEMLMRGESINTFNPRKFVFIGFNRLTSAETIIFEQLQKQNKAHFYWDYDPALMAHLNANPAGRFISKYVERFAECNPNVQPPARPAMHQVDVISVPSAVGQAKVMEQLLSNDSAVVLPDEGMLLPVMTSIPATFHSINVTMGYPMRFSALSQLFAQLTSLQLRTMKNLNGDIVLFRDDVRAIITNPLVQTVFNTECQWVESYMRSNSLYNLPAAHLTEHPEFGHLATLLRPIPDDSTPEQMLQYLSDVIELASKHKLLKSIDAECGEAIVKMAAQTLELAKECGIELNKATFLNLIERTLLQRTIPLEGKQFKALQVMGVLETRAMGFSNVVMLSMTDAIFPGRDNSPSFIPETLRHAYGLPTRDHFEVDAAYHFYHILSAAENLKLIYDSRTGGLCSGEMSRFIHQLRHLNFPNVAVTMRQASFESNIAAKRSALITPDIALNKTKRVMDKLNRFRNPELYQSCYLSASALKEYIHCPVGFYFNRIERICPDDSESESLNAAEYGNVIHETADRIYKLLMNENGGKITAEMLDSLLNDGYDDLLNRELNRAINMCRNHFPREIDGKDNPDLFTAEIVGEAARYRIIFLKELRRLFTLDRDNTPFEIVGTEIDEKFAWPIIDSLSVNFTMKIDRIDRITDKAGNAILRVVDYKTGNDKTSCASLDKLFDFNDPDFPKAIFQLFTYCAAYLYHHPEIDPYSFRPQIFPLKDTSITEYPLIKIGDMEITNIGLVLNEFTEKLIALLIGLFDEEKPFTRAQNDRACRFCKAYPFCHEENRYHEYKRH